MGTRNEGQRAVTLEGIDASLDDLMKAADATDLVKGANGISIDQGGHTDERGATSGGYPDSGDTGVLDSMMIGKMEHALIDAGFDAGSIAAFMKAKANAPMEPPEGDGGDEPDDDDAAPPFGKQSGKPADTSGGTGTAGRPKPTGGKGKMGKSLDALRAHQNEQGQTTIADAMDVSPFMADFTVAMGEQLDEMRKSLEDERTGSKDVSRKMAAAIIGIGQLVKGIAASANRLDQRLGLVERTPQPQRGRTTPPQLAKGGYRQPAQLGAGGGENANQLTKAEVLSTLSYMNLEKGSKDARFRDIGGQPTYEIAALYEGGGSLPRHALEAVQQFLATHPAEARAARTYR